MIVDHEKILELRTKHGKTQMQIAKLIGYKTEGAYSLIENGKRGMPLDKLYKLAKLYKCNIEDLIKKSD